MLTKKRQRELLQFPRWVIYGDVDGGWLWPYKDNQENWTQKSKPACIEDDDTLFWQIYDELADGGAPETLHREIFTSDTKRKINVRYDYLDSIQVKDENKIRVFASTDKGLDFARFVAKHYNVKFTSQVNNYTKDTTKKYIGTFEIDPTILYMDYLRSRLE